MIKVLDNNFHNNTEQIVDDIKWVLFDDRKFDVSFEFETWTGEYNSFIVKDNDGQKYRITVEKE